MLPEGPYVLLHAVVEPGLEVEAAVPQLQKDRLAVAAELGQRARGVTLGHGDAMPLAEVDEACVGGVLRVVPGEDEGSLVLLPKVALAELLGQVLPALVGVEHEVDGARLDEEDGAEDHANRRRPLEGRSARVEGRLDEGGRPPLGGPGHPRAVAAVRQVDPDRPVVANRLTSESLSVRASTTVVRVRASPRLFLVPRAASTRASSAVCWR